MPQEQFSSPEEEIKALEQKLEAKKKELQDQGTAREEKEVFREVLKEHVEQARPPSELAAPSAISPAKPLPSDLQKHADELKEKEKREEQVQKLIELALARGIGDAVKIAESATPWLLDELHDHLADDYYEKLVALRKIKPM